MRQEDFDKLSREEQRRLVAQQYGGVELGANSPLIDLAKPKRKRGRPEDDHVREVLVPYFTNAGFTVNVNSVNGQHPKGVTPGIADLYLQGTGLAFWHEAKVGTRMSEDQDKFMRRCRRTGTIYSVGNVEDAGAFVRWLLERGIVMYDDLRILAAEWYDSTQFAVQQARWGYRPPKHK